MLERHIPDAIDKAQRLDKTDFDVELLDLAGFSGQMTRIFLNRLFSSATLKYLEVGVWQGSTFCSALNNNNPFYAVAVDNFSQTWEEKFGVNPQTAFINNTNRFIRCPFEFYNTECFNLDLSLFKHKINCYFYDADHSEQDQYTALTYYYPILDNEFIFMVDDWNRLEVRIGTYRAIQDLNLEIHREWSFHTEHCEAYHSWWDGFMICVLRKS
jgi:hypothetical protein